MATIEDEVAWAKAQEPVPLKFAAAAMILRDLLHLGWKVEAKNSEIFVEPYEAAEGAAKEVVQRQLRYGREDQLRDPGVQRFINDVESPPQGASYSSIAGLIADGRALAERLRPIAAMPRGERPEALRGACRPYLQFVEPGLRDAATGLLLTDVWRYFRYTWSSRYRRPPGRQMLYLIRDAAQPNHPIMGLTALSNAVLQLTPRDDWLGWTRDGLLRLIDQGELRDEEALTALRARVAADLAALYTDDLGFDGACPPALTHELSQKLMAVHREALADRASQLRNGKESSSRSTDFEDEALLDVTLSPLFRAKRAATALALLQIRDLLDQARSPLAKAVESPEVGRAVDVALRQIKQRFSAGAIMELSTCGAVPPYGHLLGGKLALLLMLSPSIRNAYRARYEGEPSLIASQMAGRRVTKEARLTLIGTTSLYPERSSQYNRLRLPSGVAGNRKEVRLIEVGRTRGHGSSNLSIETEQYLAILARERKEFVNVNFVFGEGQSPKMRQLREGLAALGLNAADLIRHASPRIVYLAALGSMIRRALLGVEPLPGDDDLGSTDEADERIADFWRTRWLASRLESVDIVERLACSRRLDLLVSRDGPGESLPIQLGLFDSMATLR
ncbi:Druantia anti-phage system protein DruA [Sorangium sp. So ce367]|uniref:Druantia anti-phage system protein DruA n=1 Tax=Sorangium sp. So ce367 TaxID=3133305 RepID=UPI003F6414C8